MHEFILQNEGHTLGCLLREKLLEASHFAACVVKHPQDKNLYIKIDCGNPNEVIHDAISSISEELDKLLSAVKKSKHFPSSSY